MGRTLRVIGYVGLAVIVVGHAEWRVAGAQTTNPAAELASGYASGGELSRADREAALVKRNEAIYLEDVLGDHQAALVLYRVLSADPALAPIDRWGAHLAAGRALECLGRDAEAAAAYRRLITRAPAELTPLRRRARGRLAALIGRGAVADPKDVHRAFERLHATDPLERYRAIASLRAMRPAVVVPALVDRLEDQSPLVRHYAVILAGHAGDARVVPALAARLSDPIPEIRCNAALALWKLGDTRGKETLVSQLDHSTVQVRELAAQHLTHFGDRAGAAVLVSGLEGADRYGRKACLQALSRLADGESFGYDPKRLPTVQGESVSKWRGWLLQSAGREGAERR